MTKNGLIEHITDLIVEISNSDDYPEYSHPDSVARMYQVFMDVGYSVGQRMSKLGRGWLDKYGGKL